MENFKEHQCSCVDEFPMNWFHSINNFQKCTDHALNINSFSAKGFPIDELNRLALDRVKSISTSLAVKGLREIVF